ncbi:MAG: lipoyl(octanoyl) transferase LipB [Psittacicella sp.]
MSQDLSIKIKDLGIEDYPITFDKMHKFTESRDASTIDEIWFVEHNKVFTQGHNGNDANILLKSDIPIVYSDRGGQITYHGPGQLIMYILIDLKRIKVLNKDFDMHSIVHCLETSVIDLLKTYNIISYAKNDAPGVYVNNKKISSLGIKVKKGCTFHGIAINIDMDLSPFLNINPCGYSGLEMCQLKDLTENNIDLTKIKNNLVKTITKLIGYNNIIFK